MSQTQFLMALAGLRTSSQLNLEIPLTSRVKISALSKPLLRAMGDSFPQAAGINDHDFLLKQSVAVTYKRSPSTEDDGLDLAKLVKIANAYATTLWFLKDHAVNCTHGYLSRRSAKQLITKAESTPYYSNAQGKDYPTEFTIDELKQSAHLFRMIHLEEAKMVEQNSGHPMPERFKQAYYFVQLARGRPELGLKVVNYCSALEALFGVDSYELTHRLAETVSAFLHTETSKRLERYHWLKKAYHVRSSIVHGSSPDGKNDSKIKEYSVELDGLLRIILLRILSDAAAADFFASGKDDSKGRDLKQRLQLMVFGDNHFSFGAGDPLAQ